MAGLRIEESYLPDQFHEFYREVIRWKREVSASGDRLVDPADAGGGESPAETAALSAEAVANRLLAVLEEQAVESGRRGGEYGLKFYQEAQYVMAALADEIFLNMAWEGRETWKTSLLEFRLFGTHVAGELFFQRLDKLLEQREAAAAGMAAVYLTALTMGFRGKFRDKDDQGRIDHYRRRLFSFIFHRNPDLLNAQRLQFPEAYAHTLEQGTGKNLPGMGRWVALVVSVLVLFLLFSHFLWAHLTGDMADLISGFLL